jgi:hypothetical protein
MQNSKNSSYYDCSCTKYFGGKGFSAAICFYQDICVISDWREGSLMNIMMEDGRDCVKRLD